MRRTKVWARTEPWSNSVALLVKETTRDGALRIGKLILEPANDNEHIEPTVRLDRDDAQVLMDELWNCGLRPTEGSGSAGSLAATQRHLEDLRAIAFHKLGIANSR
jgi:hypothetical protein